MNAIQLLDSRSFRNKLDAFVALASRKRPAASDAELAEFLQPVLDAAGGGLGQGVAVPAVTPAAIAPLTEDERIVAAPVEPIVDRMDRWIKETAPIVARLPMDAKGVRMLAVGEDIPVSELTGYLQDKTDAPFFIDPSEMTMMDPQTRGWILPVRTR